MFKVLVVEDDKSLNKSITAFLNRNGYDAVGVLSADEGYDEMYKQMFDIIVSDIMMPQTDGYEFVSNIRTVNKDIPILFMTARDDMLSKQRGFRLGVDDYMVKPIEPDELILRIEALLRRAKISNCHRLVIGNLIMDCDERAALLEGKEIPMTAREFNILFKLLSYPKKTFTRQALMDEFWNYDSSASTRTVDVYITKIREKFSSCTDFEIQTVHGLGYKAILK